MMAQLDPGSLTTAQQAVLAAWPDFEAAAAVKWCSVDRLAKLFHGASSVGDLPDDAADELADLMRTATTRLRQLAPTARGRE